MYLLNNTDLVIDLPRVEEYAATDAGVTMSIPVRLNPKKVTYVTDSPDLQASIKGGVLKYLLRRRAVIIVNSPEEAEQILNPEQVPVQEQKQAIPNLSYEQQNSSSQQQAAIIDAKLDALIGAVSKLAEVVAIKTVPTTKPANKRGRPKGSKNVKSH